jgi:hypothetical protein
LLKRAPTCSKPSRECACVCDYACDDSTRPLRKSNEFIVLHTIKQQEFTSSAQRARFKYSRVQANSNSSRNAPEARGNAQQTRRRVQTYREKNLFVVPLHDGVKGQTSAEFGKRRGAGIRQLPCYPISGAPSQQPRPHAIAALPLDVGHPS